MQIERNTREGLLNSLQIGTRPRIFDTFRRRIHRFRERTPRRLTGRKPHEVQAPRGRKPQKWTENRTVLYLTFQKGRTTSLLVTLACLRPPMLPTRTSIIGMYSFVLCRTDTSARPSHFGASPISSSRAKKDRHAGELRGLLGFRDEVGSNDCSAVLRHSTRFGPSTGRLPGSVFSATKPSRQPLARAVLRHPHLTGFGPFSSQ